MEKRAALWRYAKQSANQLSLGDFDFTRDNFICQMNQFELLS